MCPSTTYFVFWGQGIFLYDLGHVQCSDKSIAIMSSRTLVDEQQEGWLSVLTRHVLTGLAYQELNSMLL